MKAIIKMIVVITMIFAGVTGCFAQYHRYHRPYYGGYYYGPRVYTGTYYGGYYRVYPRTVVVERPVYTTTTRTTTTTTTTKTKSTSFEGDKVKVERLSGKLFRVKGEKSESVLTTENANFRVITTKLGSVTVQTNGKDDVIDVKVLHGDKVVQQSQL